ncbi:MAG: 23S rRNA (pseudouridine(1915)-N(3))-methyltransferase RlmH [Magnetovibrio sp.]|nr:23S rRNA (pseudouridine(1915)-N(3))-methyltransferase RlmH [Magnetovibrio sp.]|tara:strand:+ start:222 stop:680 length:459 start_codon:yes stop_codon:yes gene_type:complete
MFLTILAIGRTKKGPLTSVFDQYVSRINWPIELHELVIKAPLSGSQRIKKEGSLLLSHIKNTVFLVALDPTGKQLSSPNFASQLSRWRDDGVNKVTFLIGGSNGLDDAILSRAHFVISFGVMTWPHMLIRTMLVEQIYRAQCILLGHPYHRG